MFVEKRNVADLLEMTPKLVSVMFGYILTENYLT